MKILELFSGTASFATVAKERGHNTFTIDIEPSFNPDMVADIASLQTSNLPLEWRHPDIVWASPPCECFSVAVISKNWKTAPYHSPQPVREKTVRAMHLVEHTFKLIKELKPTYHFVENPRAMLRKMSFVKGWHRSTVTYCQYGFDYQKVTDIFNNCYEWKPRPVCSPNAPCHVRAPRGSKTGLQGVKKSMRAVVPRQLCEEILVACEVSVR